MLFLSPFPRILARVSEFYFGERTEKTREKSVASLLERSKIRSSRDSILSRELTGFVPFAFQRTKKAVLKAVFKPVEWEKEEEEEEERGSVRSARDASSRRSRFPPRANINLESQRIVTKRFSTHREKIETI